MLRLLKRDKPLSATAYYWNQIPNFGDALTPLLLERFAHIKAERRTISQSSIVCAGSVLEHIPPEWDGIILGAGKLHADSRLQLHHDTATILALRGPLSASGVRGDFVYGDPGLLADELVHVESRKYRLGIVPHWSDKELAHNPTFTPYNPRIIDPTGDPLEVIKAIGECDKIVSSSLHGIIVADSFGIPRRFEYTKQFDRDGGVFKFKDYSAAISTPFKIGETVRVSKFHVEDVKDQLFDQFRRLEELVRKG